MAKRPAPQSKEELNSVTGGFFKSIRAESDRGCVLVAAAFLDESLESLLRSKMLVEKSARKACVEPLFATMGPLGSFWAKAHLVRALELICDWEYADLHRIRELRNHFAHSYEEASFGDLKAIDISKQLEAVKRQLRSRPSQGKHTERTPRELFTMSAEYLAGRMHGLADLHLAARVPGQGGLGVAGHSDPGRQGRTYA